MPYEYEFDWAKDVPEDIVEREFFRKDNFMVMLNERGSRDWRPIWIDEFFGCIFERKIEVNQKLRNKQLGKEIANDDGKKAETEGN